jgi:nucleotide-binding universal stress UspA family protein
MVLCRSSARKSVVQTVLALNIEWEIEMKILVGYDGSDSAENVLQLAVDHGKAFGAEVHVLHSKVTDLSQKEHEQDQQDMEDVKNSLEKQGVSCTTYLLVVNMDPGEHLVSFAEEHGMDEIIIGVRMRSRVGKLIMGSTAQQVILEASCPVVSVK